LRKLASLFPGTRHPKRALDLNDAIPIFLTVSAVVGFAFLGVLTSPQFAGLVALRNRPESRVPPSPRCAYTRGAQSPPRIAWIPGISFAGRC
jgi:hypothetical protein